MDPLTHLWFMRRSSVLHANGPIEILQPPDQIPVDAELNMLLTFCPRTAMAPTQMTEMRASSRPYSASEAPSSALTNFLAAAMNWVMVGPLLRMVQGNLKDLRMDLLR